MNGSVRRAFNSQTAALILLAACWLPSAEVRAESGPADLRAEVFGILFQHCWECHNAGLAEGGLCLDSPAGLRAGGFSGKSLLEGAAADNELLRRVTSSDPAYRMPKGKPPLRPDEQHTLQVWLNQGAPWPDDQIAGWSNRREYFSRTFWARLGRTLVGQSAEIPLVRGMFALLLAVVVATLAAARLRKRSTAAGARHAAADGWRQWVALWRPWHGVLAGLLVIVGCGVYWLWLEYEQEGLLVADLRAALWQARHPAHATRAVYGVPPRPLRPLRPRRLGGTYYRGNWDRHPALFNGGNFRTATFHLSLCDADGRKLEAGSEVSRKLLVRLELVRAAHQSDALFDDASIGQLFVSNQDLTAPNARLPGERVGFVAVEPGRRWIAEYPLTAQTDAPAGRAEGLLYVYRARREPLPDVPLWAECQYGIAYELLIADRRLTDQSDLWMGPLYANDTLALPQPGRVPLEEWFDDREIPEIPDGAERDPYAAGQPAPFADFGRTAEDD